MKLLNDSFFVKMFSEPEMMEQIMDTIGLVLYNKLNKPKVIRYKEAYELVDLLMVAESRDNTYGKKKNE